VRVLLANVGQDGTPSAWELLKDASEPHALLKLFYHGSHPDVLKSIEDPGHFPNAFCGQEMDEALLIPVSTIEAITAETTSPSCEPEYKEAVTWLGISSPEVVHLEPGGEVAAFNELADRLRLEPGDVKFVGSTEGRWSVDKDYRSCYTIVTLRIPFTEGVGEDERGVRKLISERLNEIGDVLMNLWRKGQVK
jgi:hypothetical protein